MSFEGERIVLAQIARKGMWYLLSFSNEYQVRASKKSIDDFSLREGCDFELSEFENLKGILEKKFARYTGESFLARRAYSIGEFRLRMRQKQVSQPMIEKVVNDFCELGLLDDYKYAKGRLTSLLDRKPAGRGYLVADLQKKLVPREIAENVAGEVLEGVDEVDLALRLLEKRRASLTKIDVETAKRKAYTYLSRRAISYGAVREAFEKFLTDSET